MVDSSDTYITCIVDSLKSYYICSRVQLPGNYCNV